MPPVSGQRPSEGLGLQPFRSELGELGCIMPVDLSRFYCVDDVLGIIEGRKAEVDEGADGNATSAAAAAIQTSGTGRLPVVALIPGHVKRSGWRR